MPDDLPRLVHELACEALRLPASELTLDVPLRELGLDSLDWAELALAIEDAFGVALSEATAAQVTTLRELVQLIEQGGQAPASAPPVSSAPPSFSGVSPAPPRASLPPLAPPPRPVPAPSSRVAITGMGVISPIGCDLQSYFTALCEGRSGVTRYPGELPPDSEVTIAAPVLAFDADAVLGARAVRRFGRFSLFALEAARQAVHAAGLREAGYAPERIAVILGVGFGGAEITYRESVAFHEHGPKRVASTGLVAAIPNMAAGLVAQELGAQGPCYAIASACASSAHALGDALRWLRQGAVDAVITGGAEAAVTPLGLAAFARMGALSRRNHEPACASRPFDRERDGFVLGEGAGVLVLERLDDARRRGASVHAELAGYGASADAFHPFEPEPDGTGPARAMLSALADAAVPAEAIQYVNAHGTATKQNDRVETLAIERVFGAHAGALWVSSTKSMMGHLLGAAGGVEAIATALSLARGVVFPTINLETPDPACGLDYVPLTARERRLDLAMSNSFGFGGQNVSLVLRRLS